MKNSTKNLKLTPELIKKIESLQYYSQDDFILDAKTYIQAIKEHRMVCTIISVSSTGMSRVLKFNSCEKNKGLKSYWFRQYGQFFRALGFRDVGKTWGFRINGCGMDMVFHTNYTIIHKLHRIGLINKKECDGLAQMTPVNL